MNEKYEYYIIVFHNIKTGEFKEYYQFLPNYEIEQKAKELKQKFYNNSNDIELILYKQVKRIEVEE